MAVSRPLMSPARPHGLAEAVALTSAAAEHGIEILSPAPDAAPPPPTPFLLELLHEALSPAQRWSPVAA